MNSKLVKASLAGVAALAVTAGGTTFAAWSDFAEVDSGAGAGMLKLNVGFDESTRVDNEPFNLAPGENRYQYYFLASSDSRNTPTADLTVTLENLVDTEDGSTCTTNSEALAEGSSTAAADCGTIGELSSNVTYSINKLAAPVSSSTDCPNVDQRALYNTKAQTSSGAWASGDLITAEDKQFVLAEDLAPGQGVCFELHMFMPLDPNNDTNEAQGDDAAFDLAFDLFQ